MNIVGMVGENTCPCTVVSYHPLGIEGSTRENRAVCFNESLVTILEMFFGYGEVLSNRFGSPFFRE